MNNTIEKTNLYYLNLLDAHISELNLPKKLECRLIENGLAYIGNIAEVGTVFFLGQEKTDYNSYQSIRHKIEDYLRLVDQGFALGDQYKDIHITGGDRNALAYAINDIHRRLSMPIDKILYALKDLYAENSTVIVNSDFIERLLRSPAVSSYIKRAILNQITIRNKKPTVQELLSLLPLSCQNPAVIHNAVRSMTKEHRIFVTEKNTLDIPSSVKDYIDQIENQRVKEIALGRLAGKSFQQISADLGVTRQRVQAQLSKAFENAPVFKEDKYALLINRYQISREDFCSIFSEDDSTYNYLVNFVRKQTAQNLRPLQELIYDDEIDPAIKELMPKAKRHIALGREIIPSNRGELLRYVMQRYCKTEKPLAEIFSLYQKEQARAGYADFKELDLISIQNLSGILSRSQYALAGTHAQFRYYDMDARDFTELLTELHLERYCNVEISASKLFAAHSELAQRYDIRNEYELHNLLRRMENRPQLSGVTFKKMPILVFGKANRGEQIAKLVKENPGVPVKTLAEIYEREYGIDQKTIISQIRMWLAENWRESEC